MSVKKVWKTIIPGQNEYVKYLLLVLLKIKQNVKKETLQNEVRKLN